MMLVIEKLRVVGQASMQKNLFLEISSLKVPLPAFSMRHDAIYNDCKWDMQNSLHCTLLSSCSIGWFV